MSRIGLTLGKKPAHLNQLDHTRRIPWAVKEMMEEERRQAENLPFLKKKGNTLSIFLENEVQYLSLINLL